MPEEMTLCVEGCSDGQRSTGGEINAQASKATLATCCTPVQGGIHRLLDCRGPVLAAIVCHVDGTLRVRAGPATMETLSAQRSQAGDVK